MRAVGGYLGPQHFEASSEVAAWSLDQYRYIFIDGDNTLGYGASDENLGYIDAAAGSTFVPGALAGIPIRTFERLFEILPLLGAGRSFKVLVVPRTGGATYKERDGVTDARVFPGVLTGYNREFFCGSSDLSNDSVDQLRLGAIIGSSGPGVGGVWTCAAGATSNVIPISAGALPAELGVIGMRIRFSGNVTAALANVCAFISANTAGALTVSRPQGFALTPPAAGDTFLIERAGVRVGVFAATQSTISPLPIAPSIDVALQAVGIAATGSEPYSLSSSGVAQVGFCFCEQIAVVDAPLFSMQRHEIAQASETYSTESGGQVFAGSGVRVNGAFQFSDIAVLAHSSFAWVNATASSGVDRFIRIGSPSSILGLGSYLARRTGARTSRIAHVGSVITGVPSRTIGGWYQQQILDLCEVHGIEATQCGSTNCFVFSSGYPCTLWMSNLSGTTGNTGYGIDVTGMDAGSNLRFNPTGTNTVAGTSGILGQLILEAGIETRHIFMDQFRWFKDSTGRMMEGGGFGDLGVPPFPVSMAHNFSAGFSEPGFIFRCIAGANNRYFYALADTAANAFGCVGPCVTPPWLAVYDFLIAVGRGPRLVKFDGTITPGLMCYLSNTAAGRAVQFTAATGPAAGFKLRLGVCLSASALAGDAGIIDWDPEKFSSAADGLP